MSPHLSQWRFHLGENYWFKYLYHPRFWRSKSKTVKRWEEYFWERRSSEINRTPNWSRKDKNAGIILLPQICRGCKHARVTCILGGKKKTRNLLSYILFYSNNRTFTKCSFCFLPTPTIPPTTTEINCKLLKKKFLLSTFNANYLWVSKTKNKFV